MCARSRLRLPAVVLAFLVLVGACASDDPFAAPDDGSRSYAVTNGADGLHAVPWSDTAVTATSMVFLPDGRALVITKGGWEGAGAGLVKLFDSDGTFVWDVGEIPVCTDAERGLLGIAIDPEYDDNRFVYLFYTRQMSDCAVGEAEAAPVWNRVSRVVLTDEGIDLATETVLLDELPGHTSAHNAGDLEFLPDGTLLVSVGDGGEAASAGDPDRLAAKILRLDPGADDLVPADNPFADRGPRAGLVYASGLRNPYRIAVTPDGGVVAGDVGRDDFEELNVVRPGLDYGWPDSEGPDVQSGSEAPAAWYHHVDECSNAVIVGDFIETEWVAGARGSLLAFADFGCRTISAAEFDGESVRRVIELATLEHSLADLVTGPDGGLYLVGVGPGDFPIFRLAPR